MCTTTKKVDSLPFDLYTRNYIVSYVINNYYKNRENKSKIKILDIGGKNGRLRDFFDESKFDVLVLDIDPRPDSDAKEYIVGDARVLPFKPKSFDIVVSFELLEHIPPNDRIKVLENMIKVSKDLVILTAPFYSIEVENAEIRANEYFKKFFGEDHRWLREHIENGLPKEEDVEEFIRSKSLNFIKIQTNNINNWLLMQLFIFLAYIFGISLERVVEVYRYYNENFLELGDFLPPTYRKIYVIGKKVPEIDFGESYLNVNKYQRLLELISNAIAQTIRDKNRHIKNLEALLNQKTVEIESLKNELQRLLLDADKTLTNYQRFIEKFLPLGTRRRFYYDLGIIGLRTIANEGFLVFLNRVNKYIHKRLALKREFVKPLLETNMLHLGSHEPLKLDKELVIRFRAKADRLNKIKILTATYRIRNKDLELLVEVDGKLERRIVVKGRKILDNDYTSFKFKSIKNCEGKLITLRLKSSGEPSSAVWFNRYLSFGEVELFYDGKKIDGSINLQVYNHIKVRNNYELWILKNEPKREDLKRMVEECKKFKYRPKISIIMPTWNTDKMWLRRAIESVLNQVYDNWELCIADGGSTKSHVRNILEEYAEKDKRIKVKFLPKNLGIAGNSNEALKLATGQFVAFLDHDDELAPFALYEVVKLLNEKPDLDFIYSDEDKIDKKGRRKDPFFKPDYSPDIFLSCNYLIHITVIRKILVDKVGGFRLGYEGSQDYDLFLRVLEHTDKIACIPKILYHWRTIETSCASSPEAKMYAYEAAKKALADAMRRREIEIEGVYDGLWLGSYRIKYKIKGNPNVSIIIPTKDKVDVLKRCIDSILNETTYQNYEIVIVDNNSQEEKTFEYYETIKDHPKIRILEYNKPFNFSAINNYAVSKVDSEFILFLNNDTEVITSEWLSTMLEHAQRKEVGAVGAKLLYPNNTIQHAGVILGLGIHRVAGHSHRHFPADSHGYVGRINIIQNLSAVTAACMLTKKSLFEEVGGFDEVNLPIAFNDVDYCLKLREKGYLIVYTPYAVLYHYESLSRGYEDTPEKQARFLREVKYMREKWGHILDNDPYYNPNLTREREDFSIDV